MSYFNIREEELKNKLAQDYFDKFDCTSIIGNVDFCVSLLVNTKQESFLETESLLWAEAKQGNKADIYESFVQLILTIGKARTFDKSLPPAFLGAFDAEKIAFVPYNDVHDIFYQNDFNWNVTPSNHDTKEFKLIHDKVKSAIEAGSLLFHYDGDDKDLRDFIKTNFIIGKASVSEIRIDKNNFMVIYNKWLTAVKPTIIISWDVAKKYGIIDGDFYLADLLSQENETLKEKLYVLLKSDRYEMDRKIDDMGLFNAKTIVFTDKQKAHKQFWNKYERPPKEEYWDYIVERRDLLVPQDVRERKGSFFTPQIWVELSQKYLTDVLGEDWQDEYYVWDCAAGTGNLLTGLTNKYNIWASTLDKQDVDVMHERIDTMNNNSVSGNGATLLHDHVFQFDFLNDDFDKLPKGLQDIINNPEKRKKLVMYINPPYAEASNRDTVVGKGENKSLVATETKMYYEFQSTIGTAARELFAQFLIRIASKLSGAFLAHFSTLKIIQAPNFFKFRSNFPMAFCKGFVVPANTFDNVKGSFPIGFFIWKKNGLEKNEQIELDVFESKGDILGKRNFYAYDKGIFIIDWLRNFYDKKSHRIAYLRMQGTDMQNNRGVFFTNQPSPNDIKKCLTTNITKNNVIEMSIYLSMRHVIDENWLNDRDQFLFPNEKWKKDCKFQNDCLAFALLHGQNKISSKGGTNHWIPFTEQEVNARDKFESDFMTKFIAGKIKKETDGELFGSDAEHRNAPLEFSEEAKALFDAGRELWRYYHAQKDCNVNASLYDIKEYFQGRNENGKMNNSSSDEKYMTLIKNLREKTRELAKKIEPKVYEYGFLKK